MLTVLFDLKDSTATTTFTDVESGAWYANAIASAQKAGLVQGKDDGSFGVNDQISREDMAVLIYRVSKMQGSGTFKTSVAIDKSSTFFDIEQSSVYAREAVNALLQAGIMNGMNNGYFEPKSSSTRAQAAAVLYRLYQEMY
ncbi:S-layer homology domain-containing protein [Paenibacillus pectinilyticus]|nr:S-layer homology domain-containing protein [Paenibacillus pectinilyticus]